MSRVDAPVDEVIFSKYYSGNPIGFPLSDLPKDILPTDLIDFFHIEGYYSENNSYDAHSYLKVYRRREPTEEEKEERRQKFKDLKDHLKRRRYETLLKLQAEFADGEYKYEPEEEQSGEFSKSHQ